MKKEELKKLLKPLIKECIKEVILDEGVLSGIISEVMKGVGADKEPIVEAKQPKPYVQRNEDIKRKISSSKQKLLEAIGKDSYGGINLFENTEPIIEGNPQSPLAGVSSRDSGVDITKIPGLSNWKHLANRKKDR